MDGWKNGPTWAMMELSSHSSISPISLLTAPLATQTNSKTFSNPVASNSIRIWVQFRKHFNLDQWSLSPLSFNHLFAPSQADQNFTGWHRHRLVFFDDLFDESSFLSFEALVKDNNILRSHFFRYLQARSFAPKHFPTYPKPPNKVSVYDLLNLISWNRGLISKAYNIIHNMDPPSHTKTSEAWEQDLEIVILDDVWAKCIANIHTSSIWLRHGLIQFKVVHRLHYSNDRLAKIYSSVLPTCPRCGNQVSLGHICSGPVPPKLISGPPFSTVYQFYATHPSNPIHSLLYLESHAQKYAPLIHKREQ